MVSAFTINTARAAFEQCFGRSPQSFVQAPGRVNLIGEHTDYNDGFVLPCAIDRGTVVAAGPRDDGRVRVVAADWQGETDEFVLDEPIEPRLDAQWPNYVRGIVKLLLAFGYPPRGIDLAVAGDVPSGAGLSSSGSLGVAVLQAFKTVQDLSTLDAETMALIAQESENRFVGCKCGIMDPLISARGEAGHALLIDCRTLEAKPLALPPGSGVMVVDSRVRRGLVQSEYNLRRGQCEAAATALGVKALRDATPALLATRRGELDRVVWRRARHVVTENQRTLDAARALAAGHLDIMGRLMVDSHTSMREDFEITVAPVDRLVEVLQKVIGDEGGARMTGGGFGGCVVALLPASRVEAAREAVLREYRAPNGELARIHVCRAAAGAGEL
ncbi:MAG TPA: galactokinase [Albitalea sp.]|uniref:galactokinase n=1 Tax=Piscinibacter sp. TaxID=1903157 RepID=UPI002ED461ED